MRFARHAHRHTVFLTLLAALAAVPAAAERADLPEGVDYVTSVEGITEYRLDNGLEVLLFPDPSQETVTVNITYMVGSRHEGYGESGMAHLLEHMVFKGTPDHPDIPQELTSHGCRPNGTTWYDRTNYFERFAATEENLDWALDLEADRMVNSFMAEEDLRSEFSVVRNEFEMGENYPQGVLMERMLSTAYLWHNYGKSTIGSRADLERVPIENLKAFYETWYQPDNAMLVVSGRFDEATTLAKIANRFGSIPRPTRSLPETYTVEPAQDGERTVTLRRVGDVQMAGVVYHIPSGAHPDFAAVDLLTFILSDRPAGRAYKALVETKKASNVFGFAYQLEEPGVVIFGAEVRLQDSVEEARDILLETIHGLADNPPTAEEVERARQNRLRRWDLTMRNANWAAIQLSEWAAMGDWRLMFVHRDRLKEVTPADVQRVARAYLTRENRTVGLYLPTDQPTRAEIPPPPDIAAVVAGLTGGKALVSGEVFDASPEAIEGMLVRKTIEPGMKVAMLPKKSRGSSVNVALRLHFGSEASLQDRGTAGDLTGGMLMRGTTTRSRQEIEDKIDRLKVRLRLSGSATGAWVSLESTRDNLPAALRLVADMLRNPSFPSSELEVLKEEWFTRLEDSKSDPFQVASTLLQKHLEPWPEGDPRHVESPEEGIVAIEAVTLDEITQFHADFYGASAAEVAAVGDFDPAELETLLTELFGGWANATPYLRLVGGYRDLPAITERRETPDKESAVFVAGLSLDAEDSDSDYPALILGNFMTGGGFLNSRLATRIRQKEGISYGVGSYLYASAFDRDGTFGAYAIYAPQNADLLARAFREELVKVREAGFTAEEIAEAKKGYLQQRRVSRGTDRELAGLLARREHEDRTLMRDAEFEDAVRALDNAAIQDAMKKHIDPDKISTVQAGDFAKVTSEDGAGHDE